MESLVCLPALNALTTPHSSSRRANRMKLSTKRCRLPSPMPLYPKLGPTLRTHSSSRSSLIVRAEDEDFELKQTRDMAAAKKRWDALESCIKKLFFGFEETFLGCGGELVAVVDLRDGKVQVLAPREAGYAIQLSNKTLLDVRPSIEHQKAWVKGSSWIPIFEVDTGFDPGTLSKRITTFMMGGWWSGSPTLSYDKQFLSKVEEKFPKDADLIVACQKGLRSLAACELLYNAGYSNLFWVQGGLEAAGEEDLVREGPQPLKFAGIGGVSEFLGWTDQQRQAAAKEGWGYRLIFSARLVGVFIVADALFIGAQQVGRYIQDIRSH